MPCSGSRRPSALIARSAGGAADTAAASAFVPPSKHPLASAARAVAANAATQANRRLPAGRAMVSFPLVERDRSDADLFEQLRAPTNAARLASAPSWAVGRLNIAASYMGPSRNVSVIAGGSFERRPRTVRSSTGESGRGREPDHTCLPFGSPRSRFRPATRDRRCSPRGVGAADTGGRALRVIRLWWQPAARARVADRGYRSEIVLEALATLMAIAFVAIPIAIVVAIARRVRRATEHWRDPRRLQQVFAESAAAALRRAG